MGNNLRTCEIINMQVDMQSPWWVEALHSVAERGLDTDLCQRVQDELSSTDMDLGSIGRYCMNRLIQDSINEDRGSRIEDRGWRMKDRGSWIEVRRSGTEDRVSRMKDRVWRTEEKGSRMKDWGSRFGVRGSRFEDRGSRIRAPEELFKDLDPQFFSHAKNNSDRQRAWYNAPLLTHRQYAQMPIFFISHTVKVYDISFVQIWMNRINV